MLMDIERSAIRQMHIGAKWPEKHETFTLNGWHIYHCENITFDMEGIRKLVATPYSKKKDLFPNWNTVVDIWMSTLSMLSFTCPVMTQFQFFKYFHTVFLIKEFRIILPNPEEEFPRNISLQHYIEPELLLFNVEEVFPDDFDHYRALYTNSFHPSIRHQAFIEDKAGCMRSQKYLFRQHGAESVFLKSIALNPLFFNIWPEHFDQNTVSLRHGKIFEAANQIVDISKWSMFYHQMRQSLGFNFICSYKDLYDPNNPTWKKEKYRVR